jgi:hypothetical protein
MSLGEYKSRGAADTRLLLHLNGNATDSSGNGNNGTGTNITYYNGRLGKYAYFDGSSSYIQVPDHSSLNITDNAITISLWLNYQNSSSGAYIVSKFSQGITTKTQQYLIFIMTKNMKLYFIVGITAGELDVSDTEAWEINKWKYVTGVYDGSTLKLYVDGVLKNQVYYPGQIDDPDQKSDLGIGSVINLTTPLAAARFKGYIDEVIIESRAWSHSEIKRYYTNTLGKFATI